nr:PREDICTED: histone-lysine N-methyltransferase SUV39H2 [Bemisia tabaci]
MAEKQVKKTKRRRLDLNDVYEVERIVDHAPIENSRNKYLYFIKWKGWHQSHNTWEPLDNLNCDNKLNEYLSKLIVAPSDEKKIEEIKMSMMTLEEGYIKNLLSENKIDGKIQIPEVNRSLIKTILYFLASMPEEEWDLALRDKLKSLIDLEVLSDLRTTQLESLQLWEKKMNDICSSKFPLKVENDVDLEGAPPKFIYITENVSAEGIVIPSDPLVGCDCGLWCKGTSSKCCSSSANSVYAYSKGKLRIDPGMPIYECNKRCSCGPECANRMIQHGRSKRLSIFRTRNQCGWGLKARDRISKGTFITQYVGEIITNEEAEQRGMRYDADGRTYLFDLDFNGEENAYTIDATMYGNESHFINHSCEPNTAIYAAFINCLDPNLPLLAIFAVRDIMAGEEITFDYSSQQNGKSISAEDNEGKVFENYLCKCGSANCRKYLFT